MAAKSRQLASILRLMNGDASTLTRITVDGLFGVRERSYSLDLQKGSPTVLTGSNGTGKSTILRLVNAVGAGDLTLLASAPLQRLELTFDRIPPFVLTRYFPEAGGTIEWAGNVHSLSTNELLADLPFWAREVLSDTGPNLDRSALMEAAVKAGLSYAAYDKLLSRVQLATEVGDLQPIPDWYPDLRSNFSVLFVTDQRLVVENASENQSDAPQSRATERAVTAASSELVGRMKRLDTSYAFESQRQDKQFPVEVINAITAGVVPSVGEVEKLEKAVARQRNRLRSVGLLADDAEFGNEIPEGSLQVPEVRHVLHTFWFATLAKLEVLWSLAELLIAFKDFLDSQFEGKRTNIDRVRGLTFDVRRSGTIHPHNLSSGEQQMVILAYEILFRSERGTLVIVDEPEISLHVQWQHLLLERLAEMGRAKGVSFLMATHSPTLLANHPEFERSLDIY